MQMNDNTPAGNLQGHYFFIIALLMTHRQCLTAR